MSMIGRVLKFAVAGLAVAALLLIAAPAADAQYGPQPGAAAADAAAADTGALPTTGSDSIEWAQVGVILIAGGALLTLAARRRQAVVRERA